MRPPWLSQIKAAVYKPYDGVAVLMLTRAGAQLYAFAYG
jgi:hypothetical protein